MSEQHPLWAIEHGLHANVPDLIAKDRELDDISWHNDTMPSFTTKALSPLSDEQDVRLWVDFEQPADREYPDTPRFSVFDHKTEKELFSSETDAAGAVAALKQASATLVRLQRWSIVALVQRMKADIVSDIATGRVPATVASFSELHDYVDANCYGGCCDEDCPFTADSGSDAAHVNRAQYQVDRWLAAGRKE